MTHDDWDQQLWELEYGLLPDDEAAALRQRIAADAELSSHYARVRERIAVVAKAARIESSAIPIAVPPERSVPSRDSASSASASSASASSASASSEIQLVTSRAGRSARIRRVAQWCLTISASLLLGLGCWTGWRAVTPQSPNLASRLEPTIGEPTIGEPTIGEPSAGRFYSPDMNSSPQPVRFVVSTPAALSGEAANPITVLATSADGSPRAAELDLSLESGDGQEFFRRRVATNERGQLQLNLPAIATDSDARVSIASVSDRLNPLAFTLPTAETEYVTYLTTDKNRYRPGDVIRYRSVTLTRFGLKSDREAQVEFHATGPNQELLDGSRHSGSTNHGVGNGEFALGETAADGRYSVVAHSPEGLFPDVVRDVQVQSLKVRRYTMAVTWSQPSFASRATATGSVLLKTADGQPAAGVPVKLRVFVDGRQIDIPNPAESTDPTGTIPVVIPLPDQIAARFGDLGIEAEGQDVEWEEVPLQPDQVQVEFFPEGGELTGNVPNRVYFHAHDSSGVDVGIAGRILDAREQVVCEVASVSLGRGAFRFTPEPGNAYVLQIDHPPSIQSRPPLPSISTESRLVLDAGGAVWDPGRPLQVTLRAVDPPDRFVVAAYCRGVLVGQLGGTKADFSSGSCDINIPVIEETGGVVRITVLDYSQNTPEPLAERLVYCRPLRQLQLHWTGLQSEYRTESRVQGEVLATDETGQPVTAVLGLSVVDASLLDADRWAVPRMTAQLLLREDVRNPEKLEDANFLLSPDAKAAEALDLLLGTQGWRRFERMLAGQFSDKYAQAVPGMSAERMGLTDGMGGAMGGGMGGGMRGGMGRDDSPDPLTLGKLGDATVLAPLQFDNLNEDVPTVEAKTALTVRSPARTARTPRDPRDHSRWLLAALLLAALLLALVTAGAAIVCVWPTKRVAIVSALGVAAGAVLVIGLATAVDLARSRATSSKLAPVTSVAEAFFAKTPAPASADMGAESHLAESPSLPTESLSTRDATAAPAPSPMGVEAAPFAPADSPVRRLQEAAGGEPAASGATTPAGEVGSAAPGVTDPRPVAASPGAPSITPPPPRPASPAPASDERLRPENLMRRSKTEPDDSAARHLSVDELRTSGRAAIAPSSQGDLIKGSDRSAFRSGGERGRPLDAQNPQPAKDRSGEVLADEMRAVKERADLKSEAVVEEGTAPFFVRRYRFVPPIRDTSDPPRTEFHDLLYWDPLVVTDEHGRATIEFDLPAVVTRFRVLAEGHGSGRIGEALHILQTGSAN